MGFKIVGHNDFYEGWLTRCLEQPIQKDKNDDWVCGYRIADETDDKGRLLGFLDEILLKKNITIQYQN